MAVASARREPFAVVTQFGLTTQAHCRCETGVSLGGDPDSHRPPRERSVKGPEMSNRAFVLSGGLQRILRAWAPVDPVVRLTDKSAQRGLGPFVVFSGGYATIYSGPG